MPNQIDPTIKALASTIGELETGAPSPDAYTKKGASGEYGRYQFMPDTYKSLAKKYLGDANAAPTVENQNKLVYSSIADDKKAGLTPAQIMSKWNSGNPNAYKQNWRGVNSAGVAYDTPAYVQKGSQIYQQKKAMVPGTDVPAPNLGQGQQGSFLNDLGKTASDVGTGLSNAATKIFTGGPLGVVNGAIQGAGAVAQGLSGATNNVLEHLPVVGGVYKGLESGIGSIAGAAANTDVGKGLISNYQGFAQDHPEIAADLGAVGNIVTAIPAFKGLGLAKDAAKGGLNVALRGTADAVADTIAPKLTAGQAADALIKRGTVKKGLLRETQLAPDPAVLERAKIVKANVPNFKTGDSNLVHNIGQTQKVVTKMKDDLKAAVQKAGADRIYPKKELLSKLRKLEKPDLIASDNTLNNVYDRLIKRVEGLADKNGGKVSNLLDLRQEFDQVVKRQYPNLYNSETLTPLRQGVRDIRNALTDFTEKNLPDGFGLKESLRTQHQLITAMEDMAEKATKGASKEIGTNALTRFGAQHPVLKGLMKAGTKAAVEGSGIGAAMRILQ